MTTWYYWLETASQGTGINGRLVSGRGRAQLAGLNIEQNIHKNTTSRGAKTRIQAKNSPHFSVKLYQRISTRILRKN
jgi:hypothetical protein